MVTEQNQIQVTLYSDAKAMTGRFAICDEAGNPVWHGRFFDSDYDFDGEQSSGELSAAKKAVWLASKIPHEAGTKVSLTLKVDAEWLTWANAYEPGSKTGGKARSLAECAIKNGVDLVVEHVSGTANPADAYTVCQGFKRYDVSAIPVTEVKF